MPAPVWERIAAHFTPLNHHHMAALIFILLVTYTLPSELLALKTKDLILPLVLLLPCRSAVIAASGAQSLPWEGSAMGWLREPALASMDFLLSHEDSVFPRTFLSPRCAAILRSHFDDLAKRVLEHCNRPILFSYLSDTYSCRCGTLHHFALATQQVDRWRETLSDLFARKEIHPCENLKGEFVLAVLVVSRRTLWVAETSGARHTASCQFHDLPRRGGHEGNSLFDCRLTEQDSHQQ